MILPNKLISLDKSILYKSIEYYRSNVTIEIESIKSYREVEYLVVLFALKYIDWSEANDRVIISKLK